MYNDFSGITVLSWKFEFQIVLLENILDYMSLNFHFKNGWCLRNWNIPLNSYFPYILIREANTY